MAYNKTNHLFYFASLQKVFNVFFSNLLRNMLWKAVIRISMKYFEMTGDFFILSKENRASLKQFTYN